jgi:hypothetical protein
MYKYDSYAQTRMPKTPFSEWMVDKESFINILSLFWLFTIPMIVLAIIPYSITKIIKKYFDLD